MVLLTLLILIDFHKHIDTISMGQSILCFKRSQVEISKLWCIYVPKDCFILANSADPDEMPPYALSI